MAERIDLMNEFDDANKLSIVYEAELERLNKDPALYMTPGARHYFKRVALGYIILAVAMSAGIWGVTHHVNQQLREQINIFLVENCKQNIPIIINFNESIQADIEQQRDALFINQKQGDHQRVALNKKTIVAKEKAKLHVPTVEECEARRAF